MKDWLIEHKIAVIAVVFIAFGGLYYFYAQGDEEPVPINSIVGENNLQAEGKETDSNKQTNEAVKLPQQIMVDVKGQVKLPGVYQSNIGERVIDVIGRAGGLTDKADQTQVNFAEHVQDEMVIYIPAMGEEGDSPTTGTSGGGIMQTGAAGQGQGKININKADEQELQILPGIGPAKAKAIIEYRNTSGSFKEVEDLKNISGIGDKTFEKLKDLIVVH
ncbi:competence protein ComEA helix-hairpin-helix repeat protein [Neobacillus bataviensis LMG 21833]|uniref:Competence protein ComEA helix-hairpin-helix repeat protein n=1 Tax=Neobacillus bataviensis LMG 21833 TaxID=1117379 RepID=K6D7W0_9BACI|nr:helix-hairpin-helix domain-containing protein [Neobacillus bataviensis]EKN64384.1 competence protein ComEA helix-hairpin-helix repeat protein [Neobacillus bataviensis LMG 21833]